MKRLDVNRYLVYKKQDYDTWPVIKAMLNEFGLAKQHIDSYNEFIDKIMKEIVEENNTIKIPTQQGEWIFKIEEVWVGEPSTKDLASGGPIKKQHGYIPSVCRLRGYSYYAPIKAKIKKITNTTTTEEVDLGYLPVMVKSKICYLHGQPREKLIKMGEDPDDPGGYFIINGSERAIVAVEDLASNTIITRVDKSSSTVTYSSRMLSVRGSLRNHVVVTLKRESAVVTIPFTTSPIPFPIVMKALGVVKEADISDAVARGDKDIEQALAPILRKYMEIDSQEEALLYIGNRTQASQQPMDRRINRARHILDKYLFPHVGMGEEYRLRKAYLLAEMVRRALELKLGYREPDDRDHYAYKRLRLAGPLLGQIFAKSLKSLMRDLQYNIMKSTIYRGKIQLKYLIRGNKITHRLTHALATGTWSQKTTGVTQMLDRTNFLSTLSHLRRIQSPLSRSRPQFEAREVHASHLGRICPVESPEGQNIGLVKNLALSAVVSTEQPADLMLDTLYSEGVIPIEEASSEVWSKGAKVFLNGDFIGFVLNPDEFVEKIRSYRRQGKIPYDVNIALRKFDNEKIRPEIYVESSSARVLRPLIRVENGKPLLTKEHIELVQNGNMKFVDLLKKGVIELIDANEEFNILTAFFPEELTEEHTHLELAPYFFLGITASIIPFAEHNQSPRNSYEAAMAKQALGIPVTNLALRMDSRAHLLEYPQIPIVQTRITDMIYLNDRPIGQNLVVAIMSYESYNMEDAVIINKAAVDRGLLRSFFYKTYESVERKLGGGISERFEIPTPEHLNYMGEDHYRALEEDGTPYIEARLKKEDVVIGKTGPPRFLSEIVSREERRRDYSTTLDQFQATVDKVVFAQNKDGETTAMVRVREYRIPELGDKLASRHGQKGVIGLLAAPEDMPYTADGIIPDLIINPHAFPSRMTVGQFLESIAGKYGALAGRFIDGSPFVSFNYEELAEMLKSMGFEYTGTEVMYDGRTGRKFKAHIFIGIVYYQKLHHMVADKMHARAVGPIQVLTRQPTEGRARDGGLRIGDMEKDVFLAYGASSIVKERLLDASDKTTILVCTKCGLEGYHDARENKFVCPVCGPDAPLVPVNVSYAFKLLLDELKSMTIYPRLNVKEVV